MDRYAGLQEMTAEEALALALLIERQDWERDQSAIAEYESWFLQKTIAEADAENQDVK